MQIPRSIVYALQATLVLAKAEPNLPIPCSEIAKQTGIPQRYLLQILHALVQHKILTSVFGRCGGYCLAVPPGSLTVSQIVDSFEASSLLKVPEIAGLSSDLRNELVTIAGELSKSAKRELQRITITNILEHTGPMSTNYADQRIA
jgi:Rrf2 family protein